MKAEEITLNRMGKVDRREDDWGPREHGVVLSFIHGLDIRGRMRSE